MKDAEMAETPRSSKQDAISPLTTARLRQELIMRWIILAIVVLSVLLSNATTLIYGPPSLPFAVVQGMWATMLGWLIRRPFSPS